jgi:hypothetical protein
MMPLETKNKSQNTPRSAKIIPILSLYVKKNPEPVRFGMKAPIIAMGRAREEGTNSGDCEMVLLETKNKSQNTPQSVKNNTHFAAVRKKNPEPIRFGIKPHRCDGRWAGEGHKPDNFIEKENKSQDTPKYRKIIPVLSLYAKKNPEPVRLGMKAPIVAMGRAREAGTNSGDCKMVPLKTKNKSQNTPQSVENNTHFAAVRKKIPNRCGSGWKPPSLRWVGQGERVQTPATRDGVIRNGNQIAKYPPIRRK